MKRSLRKWICVLVAPASLAAVPAAHAATGVPVSSDWRQYRFDSTRTGFNPGETTITASNVTSLSLQWTKTPVYGDALVDDDRVVSCRPRACTLRRLSDGRLLRTLLDVRMRDDAIGSGYLFIVGTNEGYSLSGSGEVSLPGPRLATLPRYSMSYHAGRVFIASRYHGHVYADDATTGSLVWESSKGYELGGYCAGPTIADNRLYLPGPDSVTALREDNGRFRWSVSLPGVDTSTQCASIPAFADQRVIVTTANVNALDPHTGALLWSTAGDGGALGTPAVAYGQVYVDDPTAGTVDAYATSDGHRVWSTAVTGYTSDPTVANGLLFLADSAGLQVFDTATGALVTTVPGEFILDPVVADGSIAIICETASGSSLCVYRPAEAATTRP